MSRLDAVRRVCRAVSGAAGEMPLGWRSGRGLEASFKVDGRPQDAPRASSAHSRLRASTMFASADRQCSCAVFLTRPL